MGDIPIDHFSEVIKEGVTFNCLGLHEPEDARLRKAQFAKDGGGAAACWFGELAPQ